MVLNVPQKTIRLIRDGVKVGGGVWWGGYGGGYIPMAYTVTTRMTPALRWAAMRTVFNVSLIVKDKVTRQCPCTDHNF